MKKTLIVLAVIILSTIALAVDVKDLKPTSGHVCDMGAVLWVDACIWVKAKDVEVSEIDANMPEILSIGCISQTEKTVVVIHSFVGGKPDDFLGIPKGWIKEITLFEASEEKKDGE